MEKKARIKYLRMSPKKLRMVLSGFSVNGKSAEAVINELEVDGKKDALFIASAVKSALNLFEKNEQKEVIIKNIIINEGPRFKRWRAGSRGMAQKYTRRTSHIEVILKDKKENGK